MRAALFLEKKSDRQTDMDGPMCSSLTLEREEYLKTDLIEVESECVNCIHLPRDLVQ
jgi:hypothetical protein